MSIVNVVSIVNVLNVVKVGGSPTMREFQANKLLQVAEIDASHSTFNAVGGNQTNVTVIGRRMSIAVHVHPPSASVIVLMATCFCIVIGFE